MTGKDNGLDIVAPAVAGMAVGLFFIALLSIMFRPLTTLSDSELVAKAQETQEAKTLLEKFPDARVSVNGQSAQVTFRVIRQIGEEAAPSSGTSIRELVLKITAGQSGEETDASLVCGGQMSSLGVGNITSLIENTGCFGNNNRSRQ